MYQWTNVKAMNIDLIGLSTMSNYGQRLFEITGMKQPSLRQCVLFCGISWKVQSSSSKWLLVRRVTFVPGDEVTAFEQHTYYGIIFHIAHCFVDHNQIEGNLKADCVILPPLSRVSAMPNNADQDTKSNTHTTDFPTFWIISWAMLFMKVSIPENAIDNKTQIYQKLI